MCSYLQAYEGWGTEMRKEYGRSDSYEQVDFAVNYLGYWTDNGMRAYIL